jgi:hypothetical protein
MTDVLLVSLGATHGLREADAELAASMRRAGAAVEVVTAEPVREWRTYALIELAWALSARRAAVAGIERFSPRAVLYSSTTAALLGPRGGAIRFDAPAAGNRPGRHGAWQRPVERRRFAEATLLVPWSAEALAEAPPRRADAVVVPVPVQASGPPAVERDIPAITYGANWEKKGLDRVIHDWWEQARVGDQLQRLQVAGLDGHRGLRAARASHAISVREAAADGYRLRLAPAETAPVDFLGSLPRHEYRALLRRSRVFVTAPRREDHGIAQLEALADGCMLVTSEAPGPYVALPMARQLDPRLVGLPLAIRTALDDPLPGYADRARELLAPLTRDAIDRVVADELLPRLVAKSPRTGPS